LGLRGDHRIGIDSLDGGGTSGQESCQVTPAGTDVQGAVEASRKLPQDPSVVTGVVVPRIGGIEPVKTLQDTRRQNHALAEHPAVRAAAAAGDQDVIFAEDFDFVSSRAYKRLTGGEDDFWAAWEAYSEARATTEEEGSEAMGESFDFHDAQQMRRRLPRLAALYLGSGPG
jgi:hypothetical protein